MFFLDCVPCVMTVFGCVHVYLSTTIIVGNFCMRLEINVEIKCVYFVSKDAYMGLCMHLLEYILASIYAVSATHTSTCVCVVGPMC